jgi:hypothetical protein
MNRALFAWIALGLVSLDGPSPLAIDTLRLKEEAMTLEYTATSNEVVVVMSAEAEESLGSVELVAPSGASVLRIRSDGGRKLALSGYSIESQEMEIAELFGVYPEGTYHIRARTPDGRPVVGEAVLSHVLPATPVLIHPQEGAVGLPTSGLVIRWEPDAQAAAYHVNLEQNENDGLSVELPPGSKQFVVPDGVLQPNTKTQIELAVIGENGNRTLVEILCTTH